MFKDIIGLTVRTNHENKSCHFDAIISEDFKRRKTTLIIKDDSGYHLRSATILNPGFCALANGK